MQPLCERCGRPLSAAPGAPDAAACTCGREPAMLAAADAPRRAPPPGAAPLPSPQEGSVEVDPWSVPPPEGGYESLDIELDPTGPQQPAPEAAQAERPAPEPEPAADLPSSGAEGGDPVPDAAAPPARLPSKALVAGAVAAIAILATAGAWLLARGRDAGGPSRPGVRVTVTQELSLASAPPLAPIDPSYVERPRPSAQPARPAPVGAPARPPPSRGAARAAAPSAASAPAAEPLAAVPGPAPVPAPPEPVLEPPPERPPAAPAPAPAEIPLPPPPVIPARHDAPPAPSSARAPVLQTRTCVEDALRLPRGLEGSLPGEVVLHVEVGEDGRPADVSFPGSIDPRLRNALLSAVRSCRFAPGADAAGRAAAVRTTMRLRFD